MKASEFNIGDIVRCGSELLCIATIEGQTVRSKWDSYLLNEIEGVKIGSGYDRDIVLITTYMAVYVERDADPPVMEHLHYMKYKDIEKVVEENKIEYVHELQRWMKDNMPPDHLYIR